METVVEDVERLEGMMQNIGSSNGDDSDMHHLNSMMEKILDIQHPERVKDRLKEASSKKDQKKFLVDKQPTNTSVASLETDSADQDGVLGFYSLQKSILSAGQNTIGAVVHENQTLVNGGVIKLRLLQDVHINAILVHKDNFIFGIVSLNGERLEAEISSIRFNNSLLPVRLEVYDLDGLAGIYIPGAITRDVAKGSVDNAAQMLEVSSLDPSIKAQATTAGLSAVKSLLSKKVKLVKVTVKAGYKLLLKNKNDQ